MTVQQPVANNRFDDLFDMPTLKHPAAKVVGYLGTTYGVGYLIGYGFKKISPHGAGCLAIVAFGFEYATHVAFKIAKGIFGSTGTAGGAVFTYFFIDVFFYYVNLTAQKIQKVTHTHFHLFLAPAGAVRFILNSDRYVRHADWQNSNAMLKSFLTEPLAFIAGFATTQQAVVEAPLLFAITAIATVKLEAIAHEKIANDKRPTTRVKKLAVTLLPGLAVCTIYGGRAGMGACLMAQLAAMRITRIFS